MWQRTTGGTRDLNGRFNVNHR